MRRALLSLGLSFVTTLAAHGQNPAASLGMPRASLGVPQRAATTPGGIVAATHAEVAAPVVIPSDLPGPDMTAPAPQRVVEVPRPMPKASIVEDGKSLPPAVPYPGGPISSAPFTSPSVDSEEPLFQDPNNATPAFLRGDRFRFTSEYLMWWTNGSPAPALLSTGPAATNGFLGQPGVVPLFGGDGNAATILRSGYRGGFQWWFGPRSLWAFDGHGFFLAQRGTSSAFTSDSNPLLARPFNNLNTGLPSSEIVAFPGVFVGGVAIGQSSSLWGADINLRRKLLNGCSGWYLDALAGYRSLTMSEELSIREQSTRLAPALLNPADPSTAIVHGTAFDRFQTRNQFNGAQTGLAFGFTKGRWSLDMRTMFAIGTNWSTVDISGGQTNTLANGTTVSTPGGLLALNSNSGHFHHSQVSVVPEATLNLGYNLTNHCRIFLGYNFLYWSNLLRPGDQIDTGLDVNRIPNFPGSATAVPTARPSVPMTTRDFFAQGINFGLMLKW